MPTTATCALRSVPPSRPRLDLRPHLYRDRDAHCSLRVVARFLVEPDRPHAVTRAPLERELLAPHRELAAVVLRHPDPYRATGLAGEDVVRVDRRAGHEAAAAEAHTLVGGGASGQLLD